MKTTDELVRELADREAIRDLPVRYCECLWRKDVDGLLGLFKDDATFVMKGTEVEAGYGRYCLQCKMDWERQIKLASPAR